MRGEHPVFPSYFPGEREAIEAVQKLGSFFGYGNLIDHLKQAWSAHLQATQGMSAESADRAASFVCPWCDVDCRTGKKTRRQKTRKAVK